MTRVCLLGSPGVNVQYELLSRETSREALATYDLSRPFENAIAVRTVSVGAAVSLLNDLQWYIVRFVDEALVQEPSVTTEEWLSRPLAVSLRNGEVEPGETGEFLKVYGVESASPATDSSADVGVDGANASVAAAEATGADADSDPTNPPPEADDGGQSAGRTNTSPGGTLVEPLYVRRVDGEVPAYDLREVDDTLVVRVTETEFSP